MITKLQKNKSNQKLTPYKKKGIFKSK